MKKIIKLDGDNVIIGCDVTNEIVKTRYGNLDFNPQIGDEVEVYRDGNDLIIYKRGYKGPAGAAASTNTLSERRTENREVNNYAYGRRVNKITYGLLAILMGSCGLHKFYGGKAGQGILYILFSWTFIPLIISIIEGIIAFHALEDENGCIYIK